MQEHTVFKIVLNFEDNEVYIDATSRQGTEYHHELKKKRSEINKILQIQNIRLRGIREAAEHCSILDINFQGNIVRRCFRSNGGVAY